MKSISAVSLTDGLQPGELDAAPMILGIALVMLGVSDGLVRLTPQSVSTGAQLGLGC
jgi:hypothetical protein